VKERPIPFNGEMVRAVLEGRKTQTRRVINPRGKHLIEAVTNDKNIPFVIFGCNCDECRSNNDHMFGMNCPYGQPGDRLWVKETWADIADQKQKARDTAARWPYGDVTLPEDDGVNLYYKADHEGKKMLFKWRSGRYMPRLASRINLEITGIRVERVQEISDEDACSEGYKPSDFYRELDKACLTSKNARMFGHKVDTPSKGWFRFLWDQINEKRGHGWESNPWVWVVEFKRINA